MARRKPARPRHTRPSAFGDALQRNETGADGEDYLVRTVPGARAFKVYRCPGCDHEIQPGVAHVVVWRTDSVTGEDRRHWHTGCWAGRDTRNITRRWS